jgi:hypothetical protein
LKACLLRLGPVQHTAYSEGLERFVEKMSGKVQGIVTAAAKQADPKAHVLPFAPSHSAAHQPSTAATNKQLRTGMPAVQNLAPAVAAPQLRAK